MMQAIIHTTPEFLVVSWGNGLAYSVERREGGSMFFQGDDAESFRQQLDGYTSAERCPSMSYNDALWCIWHDHAAGVQTQPKQETPNAPPVS